MGNIAVYKHLDTTTLQMMLHHDIISMVEIYTEYRYTNEYKMNIFEKYVQSSATYKIAIVAMDYIHANNTGFIVIDKIATASDKVILIQDECSSFTFDAFRQYNTSKYYFDVAFIPNINTDAQIEFSRYWFSKSAKFYLTEMPWIISSRYNPFSEKKYYFDLIIGAPKDHRNMFIDLIKEERRSFNEQLFITPVLTGTHNTMHNETMVQHPENIWEDEMVPIDGDNSQYVEYYGSRDMHPSQIIPFKIYNTSACSIVFETYSDNSYTFFTEKIVKPILTQRLFMVVAGQHYLKNLRRLGFKTFDGIIDESYDAEPDLRKRLSKIIVEMRKLLSRPQLEIFALILPIVAYNLKILKNMCLPWTGTSHTNYTEYVAELISNQYIKELNHQQTHHE